MDTKIKIPFTGRYVEDVKYWLQKLEHHVEASNSLVVLVENGEMFVEVMLHEDGSMSPHHRMQIF